MEAQQRVPWTNDEVPSTGVAWLLKFMELPEDSAERAMVMGFVLLIELLVPLLLLLCCCYVFRADPSKQHDTATIQHFARTLQISEVEAERMMLKAIRINPVHCDSLSHYATFLGKVHNNYAAATVLYDRVLSLDPLHVNTICNKGLVLQVPSDISICTYIDIDLYTYIYTHTHIQIYTYPDGPAGDCGHGVVDVRENQQAERQGHARGKQEPTLRYARVDELPRQDRRQRRRHEWRSRI